MKTLYHAKFYTETVVIQGNTVRKSGRQSNITSWRYEYLHWCPLLLLAICWRQTHQTVRPKGRKSRYYILSNETYLLCFIVCVLGGQGGEIVVNSLLKGIDHSLWHVAMLHVDEQEGGCGQNTGFPRLSPVGRPGWT